MCFGLGFRVAPAGKSSSLVPVFMAMIRGAMPIMINIPNPTRPYLFQAASTHQTLPAPCTSLLRHLHSRGGRGRREWQRWPWRRSVGIRGQCRTGEMQETDVSSIEAASSAVTNEGSSPPGVATFAIENMSCGKTWMQGVSGLCA